MTPKEKYQVARYVRRQRIEVVSDRSLDSGYVLQRQPWSVCVPYGTKAEILSLAKRLPEEARAPGESELSQLSHKLRMQSRHWTRLPLGQADERMAEEWGRKTWKRKKRWTSACASVCTSPDILEREANVSKSYASSWGVPTDAYTAMPSRIRIFRGGIIADVWDWEAGACVRYARNAPRGYTFGADDLGVYIARRGVEYHLDSSHVLPGGLRAAAACLREKAKKLSGARAVRRADLRKLGKNCVTVEHGIRAGLCRAGIIAWCRERSISPTRGLDARRIEPYMSDPRVRRALAEAVAQTTQ